MALVVGYATFELLLVSQVKGSNAACTIYSVPQWGQNFYGIANEFSSNANFIIFYCNYLVRNDNMNMALCSGYGNQEYRN